MPSPPSLSRAARVAVRRMARTIRMPKLRVSRPAPAAPGSPGRAQETSMIVRRPGITLLEVLVAVSIVAMVLALLLPAVQAAREAARRIQCADNLKQIGLACHNYHDRVGSFPPGNVASDDGSYSGTWWGWTSAILPYLEQGPLFDAIDLASPASDPVNASVR